MGTEMKAPENCENIVRNRKQKSAQVENLEKSAKSQTKTSEQIENSKIIKESKKTTEGPKSDEKFIQQEAAVTPNDNRTSNFTIKIEFDPMSIALFTIAIVTRFFRLAEPRNIV